MWMSQLVYVFSGMWDKLCPKVCKDLEVASMAHSWMPNTEDIRLIHKGAAQQTCRVALGGQVGYLRASQMTDNLH